MYIAGQLIGSPLFGWSADKFGRKTTVVLATFSYAAISIVMIFITNFPAFTILRFIGGAVRGVSDVFYPEENNIITAS